MPAPEPAISYSGKLRASEYLAGVSAVVLFVTTFMAWFALPSIDSLKKIAPDALIEGDGSSDSIFLNIWDLPVARWFIYLAILCCVWMVLAAIFSANPEWSVILATPAVVFSLIAMISMIYRLLDPPRASADPTTIYYVAVAASVAMFAGACWAIRDEHVPPGFRKAPQPETLKIDGHLDSAP
jgi:hypothetical protein